MSFIKVTPYKDYTRKVLLTGDLVALAAEECTSVILQNDANDLVFSVHGADEFTMLDGTYLEIDTDNAKNIKVTGIGDLSYIVKK